jgi:alpha-L-arabinofuranosidase
MKAVDPDIILLACGHIDPEWNKTVLEIAGDHLDYLTMHIYQGYNRFGFLNQEVSREEKYKAIVSYPEVTRQIVQKTRDIINGDSKYSHVKLAITEHNTMYYPNTMRKGLPNEHSLEAAVANAGNLNEFIRNSDLIEIGSFSDLVNGWLGGCIRVGDNYADQYRGKKPGWSGKSDVIYGTPTYHMMRMYANRDISYVVDTSVNCGVYSVSGEHPNLELNDLPELDVVSCINETKDSLTVFVVNRSLRDLDVSINLNGFNANGVVNIGEITGESFDSVNTVFEPDNIESTFFGYHTESNKFQHQLKAHSVYVFEFKGSNN